MPEDAGDGADLDDYQDALLEWAGRNRRDLPWRRTRDPWAVLVSELMLQQTQVSRVLPRYAEFLERFPTVHSCAGATVAELVRLWAGLGYNRRAVNLHRCARLVAEERGGRFPHDLEGWLGLPGVGPYTARAVLAFGFEQDVGVLDTNVARLLARRAGRPLSRSEAQAQATRAVPPDLGWSWNQAILDLGALVCTKRAPSCRSCPVAVGCVWWATGGSDPDPATGSAGVSGPQSRFEGSDREGRGRLVDALREGSVGVAELTTVMGWPDDPARSARVAQTVVRDGLAVQEDGAYRLP